MADDELLTDLWRGDGRFLSIVLMIEGGLQEAGLDVSRDQVVVELYRQLGAWQREIGTRQAVREQILAELNAAFPGDDFPEDEITKFIEDRLFELARKSIDVRDVVNATVMALVGFDGAQLADELLA